MSGSLKKNSKRKPLAFREMSDAEDDGDGGRRPLPTGWEAHEDEDGAYYWHIKSGTIQRDFPVDMVSLKHVDDRE